ncbi:MAG: VOC family protein [Dehalococcoidia bacterium]
MAGQSETGLGSLLQISMPVQDIARATAFYRDTLGLPFLFDAGTLAFFDLDGVRLMLGAPEDTSLEAQRGSILYFRVPDIEAAHDTMRGRGIEFVQPPHLVHRDERMELWMASFLDGEGNTHAIAAEQAIG